jgi:hypothetical protein
MPHQKQRLNELELDDQWQRGVFARLLAPVLRDASFNGGIVFAGHDSAVPKLLQHLAHVDAVVQLPTGDMALEFKLVRYPRRADGSPRSHHWSHFFLETWSCTVPDHETNGWMATSMADYLIWGQVSLRESINCWPLPLPQLRDWARRHWRELDEREVPNPINGRNLWTVGRLASIQHVCRDLKIEGFRVDDTGLISDLWGKPLLRFMHGEAA